MKKILALVLALVMILSLVACGAKDDGKMVYAVEAGSAGEATTNAISLGDGGYAILTFEKPIINGDGFDFAVYENSFNDYFLELAFVEVSSDGLNFVRFPATSLTPTDRQIAGDGTIDATNINNLAGKYRVGWGTPFDLEELRDSANIDINNISVTIFINIFGRIN